MCVCQAWWQTPLPSEPSPQPLANGFVCLFESQGWNTLPCAFRQSLYHKAPPEPSTRRVLIEFTNLSSHLLPLSGWLPVPSPCAKSALPLAKSATCPCFYLKSSGSKSLFFFSFLFFSLSLFFFLFFSFWNSVLWNPGCPWTLSSNWATPHNKWPWWLSKLSTLIAKPLYHFRPCSMSHSQQPRPHPNSWYETKTVQVFPAALPSSAPATPQGASSISHRSIVIFRVIRLLPQPLQVCLRGRLPPTCGQPRVWAELPVRKLPVFQVIPGGWLLLLFLVCPAGRELDWRRDVPVSTGGRACKFLWKPHLCCKMLLESPTFREKYRSTGSKIIRICNLL